MWASDTLKGSIDGDLNLRSRVICLFLYRQGGQTSYCPSECDLYRKKDLLLLTRTHSHTHTVHSVHAQTLITHMSIFRYVNHTLQLSDYGKQGSSYKHRHTQACHDTHTHKHGCGITSHWTPDGWHHVLSWVSRSSLETHTIFTHTHTHTHTTGENLTPGSSGSRNTTMEKYSFTCI